MNTVETIDSFTRAYIEAALWSSNDNADEQGGEPLDKNYSVDDIAQETLDEMIADCDQFHGENREDIDVMPNTPSRGHDGAYTADERAGYDFWLTRNRHGCGFWDGDWPEPQAARLTNAAHAFGEYNLYVGDDGLIYGY
jgi:hypothetical protein